VSTLIEVRDLRRNFRRGNEMLHAVDGVDLAVTEGEAVGIIGESGSGKSTLARLITRLDRPTAGSVHFRGQDVTVLSDRKLRWFRRQVQPVFQDPLASLNPRWNVRRLIAEPLRIFREPEIDRRLAEVLDDVGLHDDLLARRPRDLSGGERQRVAIARAIVLRPAVLVLDEPTASVDMSMRHSLLALLARLQAEHDLTYLYISHDIRTVEQTCNRTVVMYRGRLVEQGPTLEVLRTPQHVYTEVLMSAVPQVGQGTGTRNRLRARSESTVARSASGCVFLERCPQSQPECADSPPIVEVSPGHIAVCMLAGHLGKGVDES
jgi:oligopeptide/dipeptide ABC transporter ATP-binding protein